MKVKFNVTNELLEGIILLAQELNIEICDDCSTNLIVEADELCKSVLSVELHGGKAKISYGGGKARFFRGLGLLLEALEDGKTTFSKTETPLFDTNGAMFDVSRNAVMRTSTVKYIMRRMALMGHSTLMLYTEDMYEVENRPYFGHMRGRYSKEEIRDMDAYAIKLGIELIPCVQFLSHLSRVLQWECTKPYRDTEDILLVGSEETYSLIDDMLKAIASSFSSRRLHFGMDEAHALGLGAYLNKHGYRQRFDIFCEHLSKINSMAKEYGFSTMMWGDMFFRNLSKTNYYYEPHVEIPEYMLERIPMDIRKIYYDYGHEHIDNMEDYAALLDAMIAKHREFSENLFFSGGMWTWVGPVTLYSKVIPRSVTALEACKRNGIHDVNVTIWHDGADSNLITALPGLQLYAEYDYNGTYDKAQLEKRFEYCCKARFSDFIALEAAEHPDGGDGYAIRCLLYNDPLIGLYDKHAENLNTKDYYAKLKLQFKDLGPESGMFKPAFDVMRSLVNVLELKADFGVCLKHAYDADCREEMQKLSDQCLVIVDRIKELRNTHREAWFMYNKPFGWEAFDSYYGALIMRFFTTRDRIADYLLGEVDQIEELCEERLWLDCRTEPGKYPIPKIKGRFRRVFSPCV